MSEMVEEHLTNLINALTNLSPSRNTLTQFFLLLPKDCFTVEHSFPETTTSDAMTILELLGIEFGDTVKTNGFARHICMLIHKVFDWLNDEEVRSNLAKLKNAHIDSIPDPYAEWVRLVLRKFLEMPNGEKIIEFLKMLLERESFIVRREGYSNGAAKPNWQPFLDEVKEKLSVNPAELEKILNLTVKGRSEYLGTELKERFKTRVYLMCGEYHLDLILSKDEETRTQGWMSYHQWYDKRYEVRRQKGNTIKKILGELSL